MNLPKEINVLSLFNGMGCIWLAMEEVGIKIKTRYSSEIEKYPNQANDLLYSDTIQLGDVRNVDVSKLEPIDFLGGGSPCQSFSFAGKRKGMAAKVNFIPQTEAEYYLYLKETEEEPDYEDYIEECRVEFEKKNENKELIEILTLEHYLKLKKEEFEFEGQSYLFWEYIRILNDIRKYNPNVKFLLENVIMGSKWQKVITRAIGINPIRINAAKVSAQNRDRLFWTNIFTEQDGFFGDLKCMIPQPKDEGVLLKDVLETFETSDFKTQQEFDNYMQKYFLSDKMIKSLLNHQKFNKFNPTDGNNKSTCVNARTHKMGTGDNYILDSLELKNIKSENEKSSCFTAGGNSCGLHSQMDLVVHNTMPRSSKTGKGGTGHLSRTDGWTYCLDTGNTNAIEIQCVAMRGRNPDNPKSRQSGLPTEQQLETRNDGKTNCLTSVQKDNLVMQLNTSKESGGQQPYQQNRIYDTDGISPALMAQMSCGSHAILTNQTIRRLTPRECGRLQSVPEEKLSILINSGISDTQLYKMFGNGWNIKVISHILKFLY